MPSYSMNTKKGVLILTALAVLAWCLFHFLWESQAQESSEVDTSRQDSALTTHPSGNFENVVQRKFDDRVQPDTLDAERRSENDSPEFDKVDEEIHVHRKAGLWVAFGDILLAGEDPSGDTPSVALASMDTIQYWDAGVIPYRLSLSDPKLALEAIQIINEKTKWKFKEQTHETSYVQISDMDLDGCESFLGRSGGVQEMRLHKSCSVGQILHELMHVLGFVHEHSREDRDDYLLVRWENIGEAQKDQFQKLPAGISQTATGEFDYESILLYPNHAFSKNGQPTLLKRDGKGYPSNREDLSRLDIQKANALYEKVVK